MADASARPLPGHIAAALAGAGGSADSAGQPWAGRYLGAEPYHRFDDDDGGADAGYAAAVALLLAGAGSEADVVASLAKARVFVPIVAEVAATQLQAHGLAADKEADMALVMVQAPDGRRTLPVFSTTAALSGWHPQARPVAVFAARAALSAVAEGAALMVIDPGADFSFVVRRPALWALARQRTWLPSYQDPEVLQELATAATEPGAGALVSLAAGPGSGTATRTAAGAVVAGGGPGPELQVSLGLRDGLDQKGLDRLVQVVRDSWSRNQVLAERVDSLEIRFGSAEPHEIRH